MITRGVRNHNPGNIKDFGVRWKGMMAPEDRSPTQQNESTFIVFRGPWWGIRAMAVIIRNYYRDHGLATVRQIINRWAPPSDDNPTSDYAEYVAGQLQVDVDELLDVEDYETMRSLVRAIANFENGESRVPYTWEFDAGLLMAEIEPKPIST
jgi:hypothetical protein